jgi:tRNA dimethylallyltransferase
LDKESKYLIVIAGPTAAGKTELAIQLAKEFNTVILSADSRQFYREMDIGTAKPDSEQLKRVKHYFIDTKSVNELYGAGHYEKDAIALLDEVFKQQRLVFLVGGSGLYINAVLNGVDDFVEVPEIQRIELNRQFQEKGLQWLQEELKRKDETYYKHVDLNNPQRIIRALEVCNYTGRPYSSFLTTKITPRNFKAIPLLITPNRETLYKRINERVDEMMLKGLEAEVNRLREHKLKNALKTVGYRELNAYFEGEYTLKTAVEKIKQHTRNYAKRQLTWFRNQGTYKEFSPENPEQIKKYILSSSQV